MQITYFMRDLYLENKRKKLLQCNNKKTYEVCPESMKPCTMKNRDIYWRKYNKHCTQDNDASVPFKAGTLGPHTVVSIAISCPIMFSWTSLMVWNLFPFKGDFSFGKSQKSQGTKSGLQGGWVTWVIWCFAKKLCTRHGVWAGALSWWSCQSPVAHGCGLLNRLSSFCGQMFKLNAKLDADSLLYLLSHFECDGHTVHMLTQWCLTAPTDLYSEVLIIHTHTFQSTVLGCQVTLMSRKTFSLH